MLFCANGGAQAYQRLHVRSFTLTSDAMRPRTEEPFDVTLTIHVDEHVGRIENVFLPTFVGAEELGDERSISSDASGSTYRETLRLVAHASGDLAISRAYLEAIDARDGRTKQFFSNDLHIVVAGPGEPGLGRYARIVQVVLGVTLVTGAYLYLRRKRPAPAPVAVVTPEQAPAVRALPEVSPIDAALAQSALAPRPRFSAAFARTLMDRLGGNDGSDAGASVAARAGRRRTYPRIARSRARGVRVG